MSDRELVNAYLADLGLPAESPRLGALTEIVRRHVARYPLASIGPRLGDELPLDHDALLDRIVRRRRGGYCFEQNGLLFAVLAELGYEVRLQMARVLVSGSAHPPLTHRVTRVRIDGAEYLVDVGFGPSGPPYPVPMHTPADGAGRYRVARLDDMTFRLELRGDDEWSPLYRFDDVPYGPADAELGHFYSHRHPEAAFVNNLVASRILDDEVRSLRNREYHVIRGEGTTVQAVENAQQLHAILNDDLGLRVTPDEAERLFADSVS
ncbi:MAG: arylamine N-acetyltransferase [Actinomycetales bacterium]|nr:arylamine N-acetyltransferase [Actinomycetales bacterium]